MATFSFPIIRKEPQIVSVAVGYRSILRLAAECARVVHEVPDLFVLFLLGTLLYSVPAYLFLQHGEADIAKPTRFRRCSYRIRWRLHKIGGWFWQIAFILARVRVRTVRG